ncbi:MAG: DNA methyltransferase, partial [Candidatus Nitrosopolaris sp.]
ACCQTGDGVTKMQERTKADVMKNIKGKAIDMSAKNAQVSATTFRKAKELIQQNLSEEQRNKLRLEKITINKAYGQLKNQEKRQDLLSKAVISNVQFRDNIQLFEGDFEERGKDIRDNSIDLIFTDPPHNRGWLPFYEPLGKIAIRLLKEGGSLVMYAGHYALPQIFHYMENSGLRFWWVIMVKHTGSSARMFSKNVIVTYKPLLWFTKGDKPKTFEFIKDSVESERPDKRLHPWTQSIDEPEYIISNLTNPNDDVLDPLMGTGTTAIAAIKLKRRFVGIEKNADTLAIARHRISQILYSDQNPEQAPVTRDGKLDDKRDNFAGKITAKKLR